MRILVGTDQWFPDLKGGSARVATETARRLASRGHDVTVLAPEHDGAPARSEEGSLTLLRVLPRGVVPQTFSDVLYGGRAARRLGSRRFDLAVAHQSTLAAGLRGGRLDAPLALVYHASAPRELRFLRSRLPLGARRLSLTALAPAVGLLDRLAVRRADQVLVLSEFTRSLLAADHPEQAPAAVLVPGGVDATTFSPGDGIEAARGRLGLSPDGKLLVCVRRLEPRMGLEELLRAVRTLAPDHALELAIVGGGSLAQPLRALAHELGIEGRVRFAGRVPENELPDWYRAADLFVLPTTDYEGFGMVTAEALVCGVPVVGTPVGATPELLEPLEPRLVCRGTDAAALAEGIERGLGLLSPGLRRACRDYALARYAWENAIESWERALAGVAQIGGSPQPTELPLALG
jgi:glycosyltransferase involved in cell wall biosynthesis